MRKFTGFWSRRSERGGKRFDATRSMQPGLLLSAAVGCWIREKDPFRCKACQLLAIRDDEAQHRSLVRFYRYDQIRYDQIRSDQEHRMGGPYRPGPIFHRRLGFSP